MKDVEKKRQVRETESPSDTMRRIVNILFSLAGILLLIRFAFLLFGANTGNVFVDGLYGITDPYVSLFDGIFADVETGAGVFEPATLVGLVVLFIASWLIQSLFAKRTVRREEYTAARKDHGESSGSSKVEEKKVHNEDGTVVKEEVERKE